MRPVWVRWRMRKRDRLSVWPLLSLVTCTLHYLTMAALVWINWSIVKFNQLVKMLNHYSINVDGAIICVIIVVSFYNFLFLSRYVFSCFLLLLLYLSEQLLVSKQWHCCVKLENELESLHCPVTTYSINWLTERMANQLAKQISEQVII